MKLDQVKPLMMTPTIWMTYNRERVDLNHCPVCNKSHSFLDKSSIIPPIVDCKLVQCNQCGFLTYNPQPKKIIDYYKSQKRAQDINFIITKKTKLGQHNELLFKFLDDNKIKVDSFFDYGCSDGYLMKEIINRYNPIGLVKGIELNAGHANWAKYINDLDITMDDDLDKIDYKFDIICLFHVLEHLQNIDIFMPKLISKLKDGGLLYVAMPTLDKLNYPVAFNMPNTQPKDAFFKDEHINIFTASLMEKFITEFGMTKLFEDKELYGTCMIFAKTNHNDPVIFSNLDYKENDQLFLKVVDCYLLKTEMVNQASLNVTLAIELGRKAMQTYSNFPEMIKIFCSLHDPMAQEEILLQIKEKHPNMLEINGLIGLHYYSQGDLIRAKEILQKEYAKHPYIKLIAHNLAYIKLQLGDIEGFIEIFKEILTSDTKEPHDIDVLGALFTQI